MNMNVEKVENGFILTGRLPSGDRFTFGSSIQFAVHNLSAEIQKVWDDFESAYKLEEQKLALVKPA